MGLLDSLFDQSTYGGQGGGLLDFLRQSQMQQQQYQPSAGFPGQASPLAVGGYQMPRMGDAAQFTPPPQDPGALPQNAQPAQGQLPMQAPQQQPLPPALGGQPSGPGFGDRLNAGAQNFANAGGLLPALVGGVSGLMTGQRNDAQGMAQQNLKAQYDALVPIVGPQKAMLAVMNPEAGKTILAQALEKKQYGFQKMDDGTVLRTDPLTGRAEPAYSAGTKPTFGVVGESDGQKVYGFIDSGKNKVTPYQAPGSENAGTVTGPDGKAIPIPPGVDPKTFRNEISRANAKAAAGEKTEVQAKSEKFGNKMELAERNITKVEDQLTDYKGRALDSAPIVGGTMATNWLQSDKYQQAKQARDNFITALLRDESGAAIGTSEFKRYEKELFPQPGDSQAVILQKREARKVAIDAMKKSAGPGYKSPDLGSASAAAAPADPLGIR